MPTDQDPRDTSPQPQRSRDDEDSVTVIDFIDSMDRTAFRRALEQRINYYPLPRTD